MCYSVAGTVCKRSTHDATLKIEVIMILPLIHDKRIKTSSISKNMFWGQNCIPAAKHFRKIETVAATYPHLMFPQQASYRLSQLF